MYTLREVSNLLKSFASEVIASNKEAFKVLQDAYLSYETEEERKRFLDRVLSIVASDAEGVGIVSKRYLDKDGDIHSVVTAIAVRAALGLHVPAMLSNLE